MIGRPRIKGTKSNVAMNAWLPQASYPYGNFSNTSSFKFRRTKGSIRHAFTVRIHTGNQNQTWLTPKPTKMDSFCHQTLPTSFLLHLWCLSLDRTQKLRGQNFMILGTYALLCLPIHEKPNLIHTKTHQDGFILPPNFAKLIFIAFVVFEFG